MAKSNCKLPRVTNRGRFDLSIKFHMGPATMFTLCETRYGVLTHDRIKPKMSPRYHSLVHNENNSYFVEIGTICDKYQICIFWNVSFVCMLDQIQV